MLRTYDINPFHKNELDKQNIAGCNLHMEALMHKTCQQDNIIPVFFYQSGIN